MIDSFSFSKPDPGNTANNGYDDNGVNEKNDEGVPVQVTSYGFFFPEDVQVSVKIHDDLSQVKTVRYRTADKYGKLSEDQLASWDPAAGVATFTIPANFKGQIFVSATDNVQNTSAYKQPTKRTIVEDQELHNNSSNAAVQIDLPATSFATQEKVKLYADETLRDQPILITLMDLQSGLNLEKSTIKVESLKEYGQAYSATYTANELKSQNVQMDETDSGLLVKTTLILPLEGLESNRIDIYVVMQDNAGHTSEAVAQVAIDKTVPAVTANVTQNGQDEARNAKYFNVDRTATITVSDWNILPQDVVVTTGGKIGNWSRVADVDGVPTYQCVVVYDVDGDYKLEVRATDAVGHVTGNDQASKPTYNGSAPTEFTVDKTKPVIGITFDNNNVRNGKYYNAARTATVTITEHNFSSTVAGYSPVVVPTAKIAEGSVGVPGVNGWGGSGDTHTATVRFAQDGDFTLTADYTDLAGNKAEQVKISEFTVDTTKPTLQITGVTANTAYSGDVAPSITYHDINYDSNSAGITIKGVAHSETSNLNGVRTTNAYGGSFTTPNIQVIKSNDDVYTITGTISDLAGNTTTESLTFSVNRFGSTYAFDEPTEKFLQNFFAQESQDVVIREINVDSLKEYSIVVTRNGESTTLVEGKDYTVKTSGTGWKEYAYTIKASVFDKEGPYDIVVTSTDAAGNVNSNRTVKANGGVVDVVPVNFIIDKTSPTVVIDGVEEGGRYMSDTREVLIRIDDNVNVVLLEVFVDGVKVAEYDAEALEQFANGEIPFTVEAKNSNQTLMVIATDAAGNTTTYKDADGNEENVDVTFLLTSNLLVQYIHNGWALGGTAAAAALIFFLLFKRKKDDDEEEAANQA